MSSDLTPFLSSIKTSCKHKIHINSWQLSLWNVLLLSIKGWGFIEKLQPKLL